MTDQESAPRVHLERFLPASIDDVFAAWTDQTLLAQWLSPTGRAEVEVDVRVGGRLHVVMIGDAMRIEHWGEFRVVDPPSLVSFTWQSLYTGDRPSLVTVRLEPVTPTETRLELLHEQLPPEAAESHAGGWGAILDNLAMVVATRTRSGG